MKNPCWKGFIAYGMKKGIPSSEINTYDRSLPWEQHD